MSDKTSDTIPYIEENVEKIVNKNTITDTSKNLEETTISVEKSPPKYNWPIKGHQDHQVEFENFEKFNAFQNFLTNFHAYPVQQNCNFINSKTNTALEDNDNRECIEIENVDFEKRSNSRTNVKRKHTSIELSNDAVDVSMKKSQQKHKSSATSTKARKANIANEDEDSVSIPTQSDIDDKVNKLLDDTEEDSEESSSDEEELDLDKLKSQYMDDEPKGPAIDAKLASLFNSMKEYGMSKEKVASKSKEHPMPENCNLDTKQVNPEIWGQAMSSKDRSLDLQIQKSQKLCSKAAYSVLKIAELAMISTKSKKDRKTALKKILTNATDALGFITTANVHTNKLRREQILKKLAPEQRHIGKNIPTDDKLLFGENMPKKLTEAANASKLKVKQYNNNFTSNFTSNPKNDFRPRKPYPRSQYKQGSTQKSTFRQQPSKNQYFKKN